MLTANLAAITRYGLEIEIPRRRILHALYVSANIQPPAAQHGQTGKCARKFTMMERAECVNRAANYAMERTTN